MWNVEKTVQTMPFNYSRSQQRPKQNNDEACAGNFSGEKLQWKVQTKVMRWTRIYSTPPAIYQVFLLLLIEKTRKLFLSNKLKYHSKWPANNASHLFQLRNQLQSIPPAIYQVFRFLLIAVDFNLAIRPGSSFYQILDISWFLKHIEEISPVALRWWGWWWEDDGNHL